MEHPVYDAAIIGSGPAGLTAAIYLARAGYRVTVLERGGFGGQLAATYEVANYPGVRPLSGYALAQIMKEQAESFGCHFQTAAIRELQKDGRLWKLGSPEAAFYARGVILALGAVPRKAGFIGEAAFTGRGVSYCAACDGPFFRGRELLVVGGGVSAVEEGLFLARFASWVTLVVRRDRLSCPPSVAARLKNVANLEVSFCTRVIQVSGTDIVTSVQLQNDRTGKRLTKEAPQGLGVFVLAGRTPDTAWLPEDLPRNEAGYLRTDENCRTRLPGLYAAGDVREKKLRQIATAVSDGAVAAAELENDWQKVYSVMHT